MAEPGDRGRSTTGARELAIAAALSLAITLVVAAAVGLLSSLGTSAPPEDDPISGAPRTPTPRTILIAHDPRPTAEALDAQLITGATIESSLQPDHRDPRLSADSPAPENPATTDVLLDAPSTVSFASIAAGEWEVSAQGLQNSGASAVAAHWLTVGEFDRAEIEIEAEIRVDHVLEAFCKQSFGIVVEDISVARASGIGVVFPCRGEETEMRVSDITTWQKGYNAAPVIAGSAFAPGDTFHTYRITVSGDRLAVSVDDADLIDTATGPQSEAESRKFAVGLWTQGAAVTVKRVTVRAPRSR